MMRLGNWYACIVPCESAGCPPEMFTWTQYPCTHNCVLEFKGIFFSDYPPVVHDAAECLIHDYQISLPGCVNLF